MSGFNLIDNRTPDVAWLLQKLSEVGEMSLQNYVWEREGEEPAYMWKIHLVFHTKEKTHEVNGTGVTAHDCLLETWRWAEEIVKGEKE